MAGTLKIIADRLKSIASIQKITKSMKMVSVAKYARAERLLKSVRPFGESTGKFFDKVALLPNEQTEDILIFAITSDRGLCGACHSSVAKKAASTLVNEKTTSKNQWNVVCVGDKARSVLHYKHSNAIIMVAKEIGKKPPTFVDASLLAMGVRGTGAVDKYWILIYNKFKSMMAYETTVIRISNIPSILDSPKLLPYDIEDTDIMYYVQFSKASIIYYVMVESACTEHSARMTAMDTATTNASEMIGKLRLKYNRGRQATITKELIEIISGAAALKKND